MELKVLRPIASKEYFKQVKQIGCLKIFFALFFSILIWSMSSFIVRFVFGVISALLDSSFLNLDNPLSRFIFSFLWFCILLVCVFKVFDYILINYLLSTEYKIYEDKINYVSRFPVYKEVDIRLANVVEVLAWQTEDEKKVDTGTLILSLKGAGSFPIILIPDLSETKDFIKDLIKKS